MRHCSDKMRQTTELWQSKARKRAGLMTAGTLYSYSILQTQTQHKHRWNTPFSWHYLICNTSCFPIDRYTLPQFPLTHSLPSIQLLYPLPVCLSPTTLSTTPLQSTLLQSTPHSPLCPSPSLLPLTHPQSIQSSSQSIQSSSQSILHFPSCTEHPERPQICQHWNVVLPICLSSNLVSEL